MSDVKERKSKSNVLNHGPTAKGAKGMDVPLDTYTGKFSDKDGGSQRGHGAKKV